MAETTDIEWTDATWNPVTGCTLVDRGCDNCYAARLAATRLQHHPSRAGLTRLNKGGVAKWTGEVRFNEQWLDHPLRWTKPRRIFVCAHGDLFHESVPDDWIDRVFAVMAHCPQHTFQVLTKRPERAARYFGDRRLADRLALTVPEVALTAPDAEFSAQMRVAAMPLPNVWLGTSVSDQASADKRIPQLLACPAAVRFLSAEPLLGPVDLTLDGLSCGPCPHCLDGLSDPETGIVDCPRCDGSGRGDQLALDWVIVGGESGPGARPMHPAWARSLRDQCVTAGVPFFFKQWGEWSPCVLEADEDGHPYASYPMVGCCDPQWHDGHQKARFWLSDGSLGYWTDVDHMPAIGARKVGKKAAGRLLDGRTWDQMPGEARNA